LALALSFAGRECAAQTNAFTYQGRLSDASGPVNGQYDFTFQLFDAPSGGNQVNLAITNAEVAVSNGLFAVALNFGAGAFLGTDRWLQAGVRTNGSTGAFAALAPRQLLTPAPYAIFSANAATATTLSGTFSGNLAGGTNLNGANIQAGTVNSNALDAATAAQLALAGTGIGALTNGGYIGSGTIGRFSTTNFSMQSGNVTNWISADGSVWSSNKATGAYCWIDTNMNSFSTGNRSIGGTYSGNGAGLTNLSGGGGVTGGSTATNLTLLYSGGASIGPLRALTNAPPDSYFGYYCSQYSLSEATNLIANGLFTQSGSDGHSALFCTNSSGVTLLLDVENDFRTPWQLMALGVSNMTTGTFSTNALLYYETTLTCSNYCGPQWPVPDVLTNGHGGSALLGVVTNTAVAGIAVGGTMNGTFTGTFTGDATGLTNVYPQFSNVQNLPFILVDKPNATLRVFPTPPMGWNTWNDMQVLLNQAMLTNVAYMFVTNGLLAAGFSWFEIDDGWYAPCYGSPATRDAGGHLEVCTTAFSDMTAFVNMLHAWGFKVGLYLQPVPGGTTGVNYPQQDAETLANFNIDYVKLDGLNIGAITNNWLETFSKTADVLYLSNNRTPLFIEGHMEEPYDSPVAQQVLNSRFATDDVSFGYDYLDQGLEYVTNANWYTKAVPCLWLNYGFGAGNYAATNWHQQFQATASFNIMIGGEYVLSAMFDQLGWSGNPVPGNLTNVTRTMDILTNTAALAILNDPAQVVAHLGYQTPNSLALVKPLGSASQPTEWAVSLMNLDQTPGYRTNLTLDLSTIPQLLSPVTVKEVWTGKTWTESDLLTGTNFVNGECRVYRIRPYNLPPVGLTQTINIQTNSGHGITLILTNGVIYGVTTY